MREAAGPQSPAHGQAWTASLGEHVWARCRDRMQGGRRASRRQGWRRAAARRAPRGLLGASTAQPWCVGHVTTRSPGLLPVPGLQQASVDVGAALCRSRTHARLPRSPGRPRHQPALGLRSKPSATVCCRAPLCADFVPCLYTMEVDHLPSAQAAAEKTCTAAPIAARLLLDDRIKGEVGILGGPVRQPFLPGPGHRYGARPPDPQPYRRAC